MPNALNRQLATSSAAGTEVFTVPAGSTITVIGLHVSNIAGAQATVSVDLSGSSYGSNVPVPDGGGYEFIEPGSKFVAVAGDVITVTSNPDAAFDVVMSYLEQS